MGKSAPKSVLKKLLSQSTVQFDDNHAVGCEAEVGYFFENYLHQ